jgi:predicted RNase H-like nuclease (RuvC/YqgF family)
MANSEAEKYRYDILRQKTVIEALEKENALLKKNMIKYKETKNHLNSLLNSPTYKIAHKVSVIFKKILRKS